MGAAKLKQKMAFPLTKIHEWEADDCVNFAVALARITGWLLHVDWLSDSPVPDSERPVTDMTPLRVYVGNDGDRIFDVRGIKTIFDFNKRFIQPLVNERRKPWVRQVGVATRHYGEEKLATLPLRSMPDEGKILDAISAIQAIPGYLAAIPERPFPRLPAEKAASFTWGLCPIYAEALREVTGIQPVALLAHRFTPMYEGTPRSENGYIHSLVPYPDGTGEDSWGRVALQRIADRFGVAEWSLDQDEHERVIRNLKRNSPDRWEQRYEEALTLVRGLPRRF